jgi:hypothetical protein
MVYLMERYGIELIPEKFEKLGNFGEHLKFLGANSDGNLKDEFVMRQMKFERAILSRDKWIFKIGFCHETNEI